MFCIKVPRTYCKVFYCRRIGGFYQTSSYCTKETLVSFHHHHQNFATAHRKHKSLLDIGSKYAIQNRFYASQDDSDKPENPSPDSKKKEVPVVKVVPRKKEKVDPTSSRERNFITPLRAMTEFMLTTQDLQGMRKTRRRSAYENEPLTTVMWRKDVEARALDVWKTPEALERERKKRQLIMKALQNDEFGESLKKFSETLRKSTPRSKETDMSWRVVWSAVIVNGVNFLAKLAAWLYTGSHSMFAECLHSLADVTNQLILAYGIHKSQQRADQEHPYGFTSMRYVSSLISGAMIFCIGSGLSFQHGIMGLIHPTEVVSVSHALFVLGGSLISESITLYMAVKATRTGAKKHNMSFTDYVWQRNDPSVNVVLLEDMAAVVGVMVALSCMGMTSILQSHIPDALGSCVIGTLLAGVSGIIIYTNTNALVGRSIHQKDLQIMNSELESDVMIRAIHDVKGIDMGSGLVRYKAEVDFDGRELTYHYLQKQVLSELLTQVRAIRTEEELEKFMLKHGERIVDSLGAEVDRIETILKNKHPEIRHCDLEVL